MRNPFQKLSCSPLVLYYKFITDLYQIWYTYIFRCDTFTAIRFEFSRYDLKTLLKDDQLFIFDLLLTIYPIIQITLIYVGGDGTGNISCLFAQFKSILDTMKASPNLNNVSTMIKILFCQHDPRNLHVLFQKNISNFYIFLHNPRFHYSNEATKIYHTFMSVLFKS